MYTCPHCGSDMKYDPSRQKLYCEHCGNLLDPQDSHSAFPRTAEESTTGFDGTGISPEDAMAVHRAADSGENEVTPARMRYEAYLAKKANQPQGAASASVPSSGNPSDSQSPDTTGSTKSAGGAKPADSALRPTYKAHVFTCPSCGAQLISSDETVATFCSYCGSSVLLESRIEEEDCPDYVIPFRITKEDCEAAYKKMLRRAMFVPDEMKQDSQIERFRGIYMPYWIYSFEQDGSYRVSGSKSRRRGDYVYTKHYRLQSHLTASCRGLSYDASSAFADNLSAAIAPFDSGEGVAFHPAYLSGFYADRGDVSSDVYRAEAKEAAGSFVAEQAAKNRVYSKYNASQSAMVRAFSPKKSAAEMGMFPVWFLGCRSHDGKRISYAVVNGQTGKAAADLPIDIRKYLLGSLALAIPLFLLLNLFLTLTPVKALFLSIILALSCLFLSNRQLNRLYTRDLQLDDMGLQSVNRRPGQKPQKKKTSSAGTTSTFLRVFKLIAVMWISMFALSVLLSFGLFRSPVASLLLMVAWFILIVKAGKSILSGQTPTAAKRTVYAAPMKEKWSSLCKPGLSIVIAVGILIWNPVSDLYYYIGAAVALGCVIWSFFDIIKEHNMLTTRKLPQLGKRGGDENA